MTKKTALFLLAPLFVFGTIEVATPKFSTKEVIQTPQEEGGNSQPVLDDEIKPEATTPPFLESGYQKQFFRTLIFVGILIAFFLIVIFIYRRGAPMSKITSKNTKNNIKILERRALSPQTYLYHIQVGDKQFILSESKVDTRHITTLDWPDRK